MSAAAPITCQNCGGALTPADEQCHFCGQPNPENMRARLRSIETLPRPSLVRQDTTRPLGLAADVWFKPILQELASAQATGCKVIANVGLSEAGKSWLIARMSKLRPGTHRSTLYSERERPVGRVLQSGDHLKRTTPDEAFVWHLVPPEQYRGPCVRSGSWRIVDIAGELVSEPQFINNIVRGRPLYDLLTMTLAHASALVLVVDGEALKREEVRRQEPGTRSVDEQNESILNDLVRLMRFLQHHTARGRVPTSLEQLAVLKEEIGANPTLDLGIARPRMLAMPALLLITKADALVDLPPHESSVPLCPLDLAERHLRLTHTRALQNFAMTRWAAAAPFVGQSAVASDKERLDFQRASYGVGQALEWLDSELRPRARRSTLTAQAALQRLGRWSPFTGRRRTAR